MALTGARPFDGETIGALSIARVDVIAGREIADQATAFGRRQRRVRGFADQRIPEQRDVAMTVVHHSLLGFTDERP